MMGAPKHFSNHWKTAEKIFQSLEKSAQFFQPLEKYFPIIGKLFPPRPPTGGCGFQPRRPSKPLRVLRSCPSHSSFATDAARCRIPHPSSGIFPAGGCGFQPRPLPTVRTRREPRIFSLFSFLFSLASASALAGTVTGADWIVRFNLPDQTTSYKTIGPDEFLIRDAWLARIDALKKGDWACLSTYTFSGPSESVGAAGPILGAISNALARGASVGFVAGYSVDVASNYWPGCSLKSLSSRKSNPLKLSRAPSGGIMHDKLGVFWYKTSKERWVLSGSWNYTGGASSQQWNILTEIRNDALAVAVSNELSQMLGGLFHANPAKSHDPDGSRFRLSGAAADSWVRFSPYPDGSYGGDNALRDITNAIAGATTDIYFSLNKLTRADVVDQLIRACNRGVTVHGVIPKSDRLYPGSDSYAMYTNLLYSPAYTTANRVRLYDAFYAADRASYDNNNRDLVHTKYMVIDPLGAKPLVIHGSANWTASALVLTSANDENVLFLSHPGIASAFLAQFAAETDGLNPQLLSLAPRKGVLDIGYWLPPLPSASLPSVLAASPSLIQPRWSKLVDLDRSPGEHSISVPAPTNAALYFGLR